MNPRSIFTTFGSVALVLNSELLAPLQSSSSTRPLLKAPSQAHGQSPLFWFDEVLVIGSDLDGPPFLDETPVAVRLHDPGEVSRGSVLWLEAKVVADVPDGDVEDGCREGCSGFGWRRMRVRARGDGGHTDSGQQDRVGQATKSLS
jgi:hypothetical protein